jgi:hypothetical protein
LKQARRANHSAQLSLFMKKIFFLIASALFIASCSSEKEELSTPFQAGQEVTLNASLRVMMLLLVLNVYRVWIATLVLHQVSSTSHGMQATKYK